MFKFEHETKTSENYDLTRQMVGLELTCEGLACGSRFLGEQTALAGKVARVEFNPRMLERARTGGLRHRPETSVGVVRRSGGLTCWLAGAPFWILFFFAISTSFFT
jgi:hypothetical protein